MNLQIEVEQLRAEVGGLREELASVQAELVRLRRSLAGLRATGASAPGTPQTSGYSRYPESEGSYSLVTDNLGGFVPTAAPHLRDERAPETPIEILAAAPLRGNCPSASITWEQRQEVARKVGEWIGRSAAAVIKIRWQVATGLWLETSRASSTIRLWFSEPSVERRRFANAVLPQEIQCLWDCPRRRRLRWRSAAPDFLGPASFSNE